MVLLEVLPGTVPDQLERFDRGMRQLEQLGRPRLDGGDLGILHLAKVDEARRPLLLVGGLALPVVVLVSGTVAIAVVVAISIVFLLFFPATTIIVMKGREI